MKKKNIYVNQSQELLSLFEEAGNSGKVMCVPIDYAKKATYSELLPKSDWKTPFHQNGENGYR